MKLGSTALLIPFFGIVFTPLWAGSLGSAVTVGPGVLKPFYPPSEQEVEIFIPQFKLDRFPVTNAEFLSFVKVNPEWKRGEVSKLFSDDHYLQHWSEDEDLGNKVDGNQPVVNVSWFAAREYCISKGKRLPTQDEWEFAAAASQFERNDSQSQEWKEKILKWYAQPNTNVMAHVGSSPANAWGVYDLHGLIWEWVLDFNSALVSGDSRLAGDKERVSFCGAGALLASDKFDYASFMRIAFRSALEARYTTANLGFRCAQS